jgi:2'-5' RNA ligase
MAEREPVGPAGVPQGETVRVFLAVFPPPDVQAAAARAIETLRTSGDRVSWVKRENLHYTLRFLGEVGADGAKRAGEAAGEAAKAHAPFGGSLGAFGAFPSARGARVLWIGMSQGVEPMRRLADSLDEALQRRGFGRPDQAFEPHLTVGRVRTATDWTAKLIASASVEARFQVDRILVVKSTMTPRGSIYEPLLEAKLSGPIAG